MTLPLCNTRTVKILAPPQYGIHKLVTKFGRKLPNITRKLGLTDDTFLKTATRQYMAKLSQVPPYITRDQYNVPSGKPRFKNVNEAIACCTIMIPKTTKSHKSLNKFNSGECNSMTLLFN